MYIKKLATRKVEWSDLEEISKLDLMDDDIMEIVGTGPEDIPLVLASSCLNSFGRICRCVYEISTGKILGVHGVTTGDTIWFLSDKQLLGHWKEFVRGSKDEFAILTEDAPYAFNYVHVNHKRALLWLAWLGFTKSHDFFTFPPKTEQYKKLEFHKE